MRTRAALLFVFFAGVLMAQETITLFECHEMAIENAPRLKDREIIQQIGDLKTDQAGTNWYPSLNLNGKMSYQSDVVTVALDNQDVPVNFSKVPHDQYAINLDITQTLYDGGKTKQVKVYEQAAAAADIQQVEVDLYGLKGKVNQYYFAILAMQENRRNLEVHFENLEARYQVVKMAFENGTMVESEFKVIKVEMLKVQQSLVEVDARKKSYTEALNVICGTQIGGEIELDKPQFDEVGGEGLSRPEYRLFELKDASMEASKELISKKRMPLLYAYGQTGYGNPGYNMLSSSWDFYYMVGAGLRWNIWDWNTNSRDRQVIEHQQSMLQNKRSSFDKELESLRVQEEAKIEQYRKSLKLEEEVLQLQKEISEHAALRLENGTITATDYITELNKESISRINLAMHQVNLMKSIANYLNIQGNL